MITSFSHHMFKRIWAGSQTGREHGLGGAVEAYCEDGREKVRRAGCSPMDRRDLTGVFFVEWASRVNVVRARRAGLNSLWMLAKSSLQTWTSAHETWDGRSVVRVQPRHHRSIRTTRRLRRYQFHRAIHDKRILCIFEG